MKVYMLIPVILMMTTYTSYSQDTLFQKFPDKISVAAKKYQAHVEMCSEKALSHLIKQEKNMQKKLWKVDSAALPPSQSDYVWVIS